MKDNFKIFPITFFSVCLMSIRRSTAALDNVVHILSWLELHLAVTSCFAGGMGTAMLADCLCPHMASQHSVAARLLWHSTGFWWSPQRPIYCWVMQLLLIGYTCRLLLSRHQFSACVYSMSVDYLSELHAFFFNHLPFQLKRPPFSLKSSHT